MRCKIGPARDPTMDVHLEDDLDRLSAALRTERGVWIAIARSEGLGPEEALDAVQDALSTYLDAGTVPDAIGAYVSTLVRNAARNARRRHHRALPHAPITPADEPDDGGPDTEALVAAAEEMVRLRVCVTELCELQRAVVTLRLLEERTGEDAAETLGLSRNYVDVLLARARASLRSCVRGA